MDLVTITDHNTLAGSLDIAHLPGTFVSEEITTYFPDDGCKLHVLAWNIDETLHADITRARENVFDLTALLRDRGVPHSLAHPMYSLNDRLTPDHFERLLLMFRNFEMNGSRDDYQNGILAAILTSLTRDDMEDMAARQAMDPLIPAPWRKNLTAGSDDHSSLNVARTFSCVDDATDASTFFQGLEAGRWSVEGHAATPKTMAHNLYSIAFQFYKDKLGLQRWIGRDLLLRFADRALTRARHERPGFVERLQEMVGRLKTLKSKKPPRSLLGAVHREALEIVYSHPELGRAFDSSENKPWESERHWFDFVDRSSEKVMRRLADSVMDSVSGANLFDLFSTLGAAGSSYALLAPYFVAYSLFTKDRAFCRECYDIFRRRRHQTPPRDRLKVAHFTDTFFDVNGVARTLRQQVETAAKNGKDLTLITCAPESAGRTEPNVLRFDPIGTWDMPEYPGLTLHYPPLLKILDHCYREGYTRIHAATPGPVGLAALAVARILKIPFMGTYHTAFPQYAERLTGDAAMKEAMWRYMVWFHNQMDVVFAPSKSFARELAEKGVDEKRITFYPRGIDTRLFHPSRRNGFYLSRYGLDPGGETLLLYVGRVSREKGLDHLARAFGRMCEDMDGLRLVVVGNGPYLSEMRDELKNLPALFTGFLAGEDLAAAYASADLFVFPSATDTFGNAVLEAQASGLPVVVTECGGPAENMIHEQTGLCVPPDDSEALARAVLRLAQDIDLRARMGQNARDYTKNRSFESCYLDLWNIYRSASAGHAGPDPDAAA